MRIEARAYAKINWLLDVGRARQDGYHELCTLFQTIDLYDEITIERSDKLSLELIGQGSPSVKADDSNLVLRAAWALQNRFEQSNRKLPGARIHLKKQIPVGAGLGGGSSDAATTLIALDEFWD